MKKKDKLRDIYQSEPRDIEKDFTPQVSQATLEQRQCDLRRMRVVSLLFGGLTLLFIITLISIVIQNSMRGKKTSETVPAQEVTISLRRTQPLDEAWVMDYKPTDDPPTEELTKDPLTGTPGEKPLSAKWVKKAAYHIITGQRALALEEPDSALEHFEKIIAIYPGIEGLRSVIGRLYIDRKEFDQAAEHLEHALQERETFGVLNNLSTAYIGSKEYDEAKKHLLRALELHPESPICHKNLARLYRKMKNEAQAIFHFEKYIDLRPNDFDTLQTYALYLTKLKRWEQAAEFLIKLTTAVTDVPPLYFILAQVQTQNSQQEQALEALQKGIQRVSPDLARVWMSHDDFDDLRDLNGFKKLVNELGTSARFLDDSQ